MNNGKSEIFVFVFIILVLSLFFVSGIINSTNYQTDIGLDSGGDNLSSTNYQNNVISGVISENLSSTNYNNDIGFFYGVYTNTAPNNPSPVINSTDGTNKTKQDLNCFATISDPDEDNINVSVRWYKDGALNLSIDYNNSYSNSSLFISTLDYHNTTKADVWKCGIRFNDGYLSSDWVNSSNLTILNTAPNVTLISPANSNFTTDRTPLFNWTSQDDDGDSMTYDINITSPQCGTDNRTETGISDSNYTPSSILRCLYDHGDYYLWKVRANDGEEYGSWTSEWIVNISAYVDINLSVDVVNFGFKNASYLPIYKDNTTDDDPSPFVVENVGNAITNVSINATSLWVNQPGTSSYYKFKVDNVSGEEGSFNWLSSIVSWKNMSITGAVTAISELNYSDATDSAEVDMYIQVPPNEPSGLKQSTIIFASSLAE